MEIISAIALIFIVIGILLMVIKAVKYLLKLYVSTEEKRIRFCSLLLIITLGIAMIGLLTPLITLALAILVYLSAFILLKEGESISSTQHDNGELIVIGKQTWTRHNINRITFQNGDRIKNAKTQYQWKRALRKKQPAWCYYNNDSKNRHLGKLYNIYAILDNRNLAPEGFRIPSSSDFKTLILNLEGKGIMNFGPIFIGSRSFPKSISGKSIINYSFLRIGESVSYASNTLNNEHTGICQITFYKKDDQVLIDDCILGFERGYALRCIKDYPSSE